MGTIAQLGQLYPAMLDVPDTDAVVKKLGELRGVPFSLLNDDEDLAKVREERQARQQAAETLAAAQAGGDAMQSMAAGRQAMDGIQQ